MPKNTVAKMQANKKYSDKTYDRLSLILPKGARDKIKKGADKHPELSKVAGQPTSINRYIENAINKQLQQDGIEIDD